jgi:DNA polymerase III epsilon subunit-like protein
MEAVGDVNRPETCATWNIAAMIMGRDKAVLEQYVILPMENIPPPPHKDLFKVTHEFLLDASAVQPFEAFTMLWKWCSNFYDASKGGILVMVAHGNFRFDKILIEAEHRRTPVPPPQNVYFFDTLHWFRTLHRKCDSYALSALYRSKFTSEIKNQHLAIYDVYALNKLIVAEDKPMVGIMYAMWTTPLVRIPSVGLHTQRILVDRGEIYSVENLISIYQNLAAYDPNVFASMLESKAGVLKSTATNIANYVVGLHA